MDNKEYTPWNKGLKLPYKTRTNVKVYQLICTTCGVDFERKKIYKKDNNLCLRCRTNKRSRITARIWYYANPEARKAKTKRFYEKHKEEINRRNMERGASKLYRERHLEKTRLIQRAWIKNNLKKAYTHQKIYRAIKRGILKRPINCTDCGNMKKIYGHHEDYNKPLDVIWVCGSCHRYRHMEISRV